MSRGLLLFMALVTHIALVVLVAGFLFFVTGEPPVVEADAGVLLGPAMVLASTACVFGVVARRFGLIEQGRHGDGRIATAAVTAVVSAYLATLVVGGGLYALGRSDAVWLVLFAGRYAASPFVVGQAFSAGLVTLGALAAGRSGR